MTMVTNAPEDDPPSSVATPPAAAAAAGPAGPRAHTISSATYPLPEPLVRRLKAAILPPSNATPSSSGNNGGAEAEAPDKSPLVEGPHEALAQLVSNSIEAMDAMYFSTPSRVRKHPAFQHRLCLRVDADPAGGTLSVTDLGSGMTRADLINSLGISRAAMLSSGGAPSSAAPVPGGGANSNGGVGGGGTAAAAVAARSHYGGGAASASASASSARSDTDSTDPEYEFEEEEPDGDHDAAMESSDELPASSSDKVGASAAAAAQTAAVPNNGARSNGDRKEQPHPPLSCRASDIGGFYAALCSLGTGVCVGTKAKHDDYYEFQVGSMAATGDSSTSAAAAPAELLESFVVRRPLPEGSVLAANTGFGRFSDVRGESGTRVTIRLNQASAHLLDEAALRPIFLNLLQTTQYTVAFSSDPGAQAVVDASAEEAAALEAMLREPEDPLDAVADMDLTSKAPSAGGMLPPSSSRKKALDGSRVDALSPAYNSVRERARYIPLRLSLGERKMLRLVEAAMCCCEYTTEVDRPFKSAARRTHEQLKGVTSILRGLVTACDYQAGQKLQQDDNFAEYEGFFRTMFEIARRHKIMNPEKMRTEYGKLVYLLQDAVSPSVKPHLGFSVKGPISSVYKFVEEKGGLELLSDPLIETATQEILAEKKSRSTIDQEIRQKERAVAIIKKKYRSARLSADDIHLCLYSICDNNSFLNSNRVPIDKVIEYLTSHFSAAQAEPNYSLSIVSGEDGARLSHSHERQYYYALQSLTLWRDIIDDMFRLWAMAEEDLLSETVTYSLQDTGQGMQRVQQSPRTYQAMQRILQRVQHKVSHWVGSSVIHMGDHNVPNALSFIDKYTQGA